MNDNALNYDNLSGTPINLIHDNVSQSNNYSGNDFGGQNGMNSNSQDFTYNPDINQSPQQFNNSQYNQTYQ